MGILLFGITDCGGARTIPNKQTDKKQKDSIRGHTRGQSLRRVSLRVRESLAARCALRREGIKLFIGYAFLS
jgi:hypothetical protein